jgi:hypothetical protein
MRRRVSTNYTIFDKETTLTSPEGIKYKKQAGNPEDKASITNGIDTRELTPATTTKEGY